MTKTVTFAGMAVAGAVVVGIGAALSPLITSAVAVGAVAMSMALMFAPRAPTIVMWAATLPLFINVSGRTLPLLGFLNQAEGQPGSTRLHVSFGVTVGMALAVALRKPAPSRHERPPGTPFILGLAAVFTLSILIGYFRGNAGTVGLVFYFQTMTPLAAWYVMAHSLPRPDQVATVVMRAVVVTLAAIMLYLVVHGLLSAPTQASVSIERIIPQYRSYFPAIEMCAVVLAITYWDARRRLAFVTLALAAINLPYMWSRGGLLMLTVAAALAFLLRPGRSGRGNRIVVLAVGGTALGALGLQLLAGGVLGERSANQAVLAESDSTRIELARQGVERALANPLLGDKFQPFSNELVGGRVAEFARLFPTHNQYLDYALRGGVAAALLLLALLAVTAIASLRAVRADADHSEFHAAIVSITIALSLGNLGELYLTQTWTGSVLFGLLGAQAALRRPAGPEDATDNKTAATGDHAHVGRNRPFARARLVADSTRRSR